MTIEATYGESEEINAPAEAIYDYRLDFVKLADYNENVTNIVLTKEGKDRLGEGAEYTFDLNLPGWDPMKAFLKVIETDKPNRIVTDTGTDALAGREVNTFEQLADGSVRFSINFTILLPDEAKDGVDFMEKSGRDQYRIELEAIRKALEA
jgi:hypothetical protein